jgi:hypothetical protein
VWLHAVSDLLITIAYYSIPATLGYLLYKRRDIAFSWMFGMFGAFILLCGTTHLIAIWVLWQPVYWLEAAIKVITACVSLVTAVLLVPLVPKALSLPSHAQLEAMNRELQMTIADRDHAGDELARNVEQLAATNAELARFNRLATGREGRMVELKRQVNALLQECGRPPTYTIAADQPE